MISVIRLICKNMHVLRILIKYHFCMISRKKNSDNVLGSRAAEQGILQLPFVMCKFRLDLLENKRIK